MEPRNEYQPGSQSIMHDHMDGIYMSRRPHDLNTSEVKPVQHYSIQTGEEFSLEFMRDRANIGKPVFSNVSDPNYTTGYMELKGILGISHGGSETGSDMSMLSMMDKYPKEFDRSNYGSIRSIPRTSLHQDNRQFVHGYGSSESYDNSSIMMKFLCSFGGRILPRPSDGKLRYVGGQTRILRIRKDISYHELIQKALMIYNQVQTIKYQLPGEDLDALVSVSSDEDIQNMMEECNHLEDREGSQKLRMFLFSISDLQDAQFGLTSMGDDSEVQYVIAVNGMDLESRKNSTMVGLSFSANDINELEGENIDRQGNAPQTNNFDPSLATHFSQPMLPTSSNSYGMYPVFYGDQMIHHGEPNAHGQYFMNHGVDPSYKPFIEGAHINMLPHMPNTQQGIFNEGYPPGGVQVQNSEVPETLARMMADSSIQQETLSLSPSQLFDGYIKNDFPEASVVVTAPEGNSLPPTRTNQLSDNDEASSTSSSAFVAGPYVDSRNNAVDLSCLHPPPLPKRVYYSERIPREQVESLNRSTKSDDAHNNTQFQVSDLLSGVNSQDSAIDSGNNLHDGNPSNLAKELNITAKPLPVDGEGTKDILNKENAVVMLGTENYRNDNHKESPLEGKSDIPVKEANGDFNMQAPSVPLNANTTAKVDPQAQGDILIDINDRFPRESLNDMFSKAILEEEDSSGQHPLASDGMGLSINMENHEPKSWSYFQKLAQEGNDNASLIDQDHLGFSPGVVGDHRAQHVAPLTTDEVPLNRAEFHLNFGEEIQKDMHGENEAETTVLKSNYDQSQINDTESMQFGAMIENLRAEESEYEVLL